MYFWTHPNNIPIYISESYFVENGVDLRKAKSGVNFGASVDASPDA